MDPSQPYFPHKEQKEEQKKKLRHRCFADNIAEFLRTSFLRTITGLLLKMSATKPNCCNDIAIEQMLSLNDSFWIILTTRRNGHVVTFFHSRPKVKMRQKQMENSLFVFFLKRWLFCRGWCSCTQCTPSVTSLIFRRTIFPCHTLTFIIQNIHKRCINQWFMEWKEVKQIW